MDPFTAAALIGGGATLIGGYLGNQANREATASANAQSAANTAAANQTSLQSVREQMTYQERMSNSAYQRAMQDMRKAGLNPMLAYQQGGASSPSGASMSAQSAPVSKPDYQDPLGPSVSSAGDIYSKGQAIQQARAGLGIQQGQLQLNQANSSADIALKAAQVAATTSSAKKTETESEILRSKAKREKLEGQWYDSEHGKTLFNINKINESVGGSLDSLNSAKQLLNPLDFMRALRLKQGTFKKGTGMMKDGTKFNTTTGEIMP